jgi:hypothetical protein
MATTTIYASTGTTGRGVITNSGTDWDDVITSTSGAVNSGNSYSLAVRTGVVAGRGTPTFFVNRAFGYFDLSSITTTITAATVKIYSSGVNNTGTIKMYAGTAFGGNGTALASDEYGNVSSTSYSSNEYNELTWGTNQLRSFVCNATAISYANSNSKLNVCWRDNKDVDEEQPEEDGYIGINWLTSGTNRAQIVVTHAEAGYSNTVNSVTSANYDKINNIAKSSIERINYTPIPPP